MIVECIFFFRETTKGDKSESFVLAQKANKFIPRVRPEWKLDQQIMLSIQMVIEFYESKLTWHKQVPVK